MMEDQRTNAQKLHLERLLENFSKTQAAAASKATKCAMLMNRNSFKKLPEAKKKQIANRLSEARKEYDQTTDIVNQIQLRLQELT